MASVLGVRLGLPVVELDDLMHGANWTPTPTPLFRAKVSDALAEAEGPKGTAGWVVPGNYRNVSDLVQGRADTIVWLDLARGVVTRRLVVRSLRRLVTRAEVCNGNRERLRNLLSRDPERNVVLWSWQHHDQYREIYEGYASSQFWSRADVHRLQSPSQVDSFVASISR